MKPYQDIKKIWSRMYENAVPEVKPKVIPEPFRDLHNIFSNGESYFYIFNPVTTEVEYVSNGTEDVLGFEPSKFTTQYVIERIHPDDLAHFMDFESAIQDFLIHMAPSKRAKYKIRYDYRIQHALGHYVRILQQGVTYEQNDQGDIIRVLVQHHQIDEIKRDGKPVLSFIGLEGEPSYINVQIKKSIQPSEEKLTKREKQVLFHLINGKSSDDIASLLYLSKTTVSTHRRNMLRKTNSKNSSELIAKAIREGYL